MSELRGMGFVFCAGCNCLWIGIESSKLQHRCADKEAVVQDVQWADRIYLQCLKTIELGRTYPKDIKE